jgi:molecular chaperone DnaJ
MLPPGEPDYYSILGVRREASLEEIKQAYHRLVTRCHPDVHPADTDAEACLRSLNQAYAILKDPSQRARYDRWGAWGPPVWHPPGKAAVREWMAAVMNHLLSARDALEAHKPLRGQDLRYTHYITPQERLDGGEARITVANTRWCPQCLGSRTAGGKPPFPCPQCRGEREIRRPGWFLPTIRQCDVCAGEGVVVTEACRRCAGKGVIPISRTLTLDLPAGLRDGSRLRIRGEGGPGRWGGVSGDLYVYITTLSPASRRDMEHA